MTQEALDKLPSLIEPWFIFALIWSVGATCDNDGRVKFSDWMRQRIVSEKLSMPLPEQGLVYDYLLDDGGIFNTEEEKDDEEEKKVKEVRHFLRFIRLVKLDSIILFLK